MDREKIAFAALRPLDMVLGATVSTLRATVGLDKISDHFYDWTGVLLRGMYEKNNDLKAEGLDKIPETGGVIFAPNHQSWNDVQVLGAACPRRLRFLAKAEFEVWPVLRHLIALSDSPFIRRGGDTKGMEEAIESLKAGKALVIFPEGTIPGEEEVMRHEVEPDTGLLRGHSGAVRLAAAAGVPIIPVGISGTGESFPPEVYPRLELFEAPKPVPVTVRFGDPITFDELSDNTFDRADLRSATKKLMLAISGLIDHKRNFVPITVPVPPLEKVEKLGVLLVHGFTSGLHTVDGLVPHLEEAGLPYRMPVLRGHGGHYTNLEGVTSKDWYADAEEALLDLAKEVDKVVIVGLSMGGLVSLELAMNHADKIAGVVTLAAALRFKDPMAPLTPVMAKLFKSWPSPESFNDKSLKEECDNYPRFMTDAFLSLYRYAQEIEGRLGEITVPISVLQSKKDQVVAPVAANIIYRDVASVHREIHWFKRSGHEMGLDMEKDTVFEKAMSFVKKFMPEASN